MRIPVIIFILIASSIQLANMSFLSITDDSYTVCNCNGVCCDDASFCDGSSCSQPLERIGCDLTYYSTCQQQIPPTPSESTIMCMCGVTCCLDPSYCDNAEGSCTFPAERGLTCNENQASCASISPPSPPQQYSVCMCSDQCCADTSFCSNENCSFSADERGIDQCDNSTPSC